MKPYGSLNLPPTVRLTEVEWLMDSGEDLDRVAARLCTTPGAILKAARRSGTPGLLAKVNHGWRRLS